MKIPRWIPGTDKQQALWLLAFFAFVCMPSFYWIDITAEQDSLKQFSKFVAEEHRISTGHMDGLTIMMTPRFEWQCRSRTVHYMFSASQVASVLANEPLPQKD